MNHPKPEKQPVLLPHWPAPFFLKGLNEYIVFSFQYIGQPHASNLINSDAATDLMRKDKIVIL